MYEKLFLVLWIIICILRLLFLSFFSFISPLSYPNYFLILSRHLKFWKSLNFLEVITRIIGPQVYCILYIPYYILHIQWAWHITSWHVHRHEVLSTSSSLYLQKFWEHEWSCWFSVPSGYEHNICEGYN